MNHLSIKYLAYKGLARKIPFAPDTIHIVVSNNGLGFHNPKQAVELLLRLGVQLKIDGLMFFKEQISNTQYSHLNKNKGYTTYEINLLKRIIEKGGFEIFGLHVLDSKASKEAPANIGNAEIQEVLFVLKWVPRKNLD